MLVARRPSLIIILNDTIINKMSGVHISLVLYYICFLLLYQHPEHAVQVCPYVCRVSRILLIEQNTYTYTCFA